MKRLKRAFAAATALGMIFYTSAAMATKVGYIETEEDCAIHAQHLEERHFREGLCWNTGEHVMLRTAPGAKKNVGRMEPGEAIQILDLYDTWAKVVVMSKTPENDQSAYGMVGWISVEYIDCGCSEAAYYGYATPGEAETAEIAKYR